MLIKDREQSMVELKLDNKTPFSGELVLQTDEEGQEILVVVLKGSYKINDNNTTERASHQAPIISEPIYYGAAGQSSIMYAPDTSFTKISTDVALIGHAIAGGDLTTELDVVFQVGNISKTVTVFGDRLWTRSRGLFGKRWSLPTCKVFGMT